MGDREEINEILELISEIQRVMRIRVINNPLNLQGE